MDKIRVLIVDDHPLMREALRDAIETEPRFDIIGEAVNGKQAVEYAHKLQPQVILMDLSMPIMSGIEATQKILQQHPEIAIIAITSTTADESVLAAIRAGMVGYLLKDSSRENIISGLIDVSNGKRHIPPDVGEKLAFALQAENEIIDKLTAREQDILKMVGNGKSNFEIAEALVIGEPTVRVHISNLKRKLNLQSRSQVAIYANNHKNNA